MKDQLSQLHELQQVDLKCDAIRAEKKEIQARLNEIEQIRDRLQDDLEMQQDQLEATIELQKEKAEELASVDARQKDSKVRLAKVSNTKEYAAIEQEIENYKRQAAQLEEELVQLMEAIEATKASMEEKQAKIDSLSEEVDGERGRAEQRFNDLDEALTAQTSERDEMASRLPKALVRRYDFIRGRRDGLAIVSCVNGACQGCFMHLPPQQFIEVQRGQEMVSCPSCQRILFHDPQDSEAASE
ncbi:MAG: hypothetical protein KC561_08540 [Myxococcales bacterium]|nr:hypothetical protein [Myxococcales bacterium]